MTPQPTGDRPRFSTNTNIADALAQGADAAAVFVRYRMYCLGCTFARFETLRTAAVNHRADVREFVEALNQAVGEASE